MRSQRCQRVGERKVVQDEKSVKEPDVLGGTWRTCIRLKDWRTLGGLRIWQADNVNKIKVIGWKDFIDGEPFGEVTEKPALHVADGCLASLPSWILLC